MKRFLLFFLTIWFIFAGVEARYTRMGIYAVRDLELTPRQYVPQLKALIKWILEYGYEVNGPIMVHFEGIPYARRKTKVQLLVEVNVPGIFPPRTGLSTYFKFFRARHVVMSGKFSVDNPIPLESFKRETKEEGWVPSGDFHLLFETLRDLNMGRGRWMVDARWGKNAMIGVYSDRGAFHLGLIASQRFFKLKGIRYAPLYREDLKRPETYRKITILYFPGGWSGYYTEDLSGKPAKLIRNFVKNGGRYLGVCAGAYFASKEVVWEGNIYHPPLKLFAGRAIGPIVRLAPWPLYTVTTLIWEGQMRKAFYYGGPYFEGKGDVLATYSINSRPAVIKFNYGKGLVVLSGVHFEYDLSSDIDGVSFPENKGVKMSKSTWPLFEKLINILKGGER